jgi:hypothetical protein
MNGITGFHTHLGLWLVMVLLMGGYGHLSCSEPSDFPLLRLHKKHLAGKQFVADADVKQAVTP